MMALTYIDMKSIIWISLLFIFSNRSYSQTLIDGNLLLINSKLSTVTQPPFVIDSFTVVNDKEGSVNLANTGLTYDIDNDLVYVSKWGGNSLSRIIIKTINNVQLDSIDLTDSLDQIQGISLNEVVDSLIYAVGINKGESLTADNLCIKTINLNTKQVIHSFNPKGKFGIPRSNLDFYNGKLWYRAQYYIYAMNYETFEIIDSISLNSGTSREGLFFKEDGSFYVGYDGGINYYNSSHIYTYTYDIRAITNEMEGIIIDKRGELWFNADNWVHGGRPDGNKIYRLDLREYIRK